jgi:peptidyl-prolyl cis-trans isomerase SurA
MSGFGARHSDGGRSGAGAGQRTRSGWPGRLVACLLLLTAGILPAAARAERELVDRVVAVVDDESILLSEVLQEMNLVRLQRGLGKLSESDQQRLFQTVLQSMISDQLLVAQAKAKGITVGDDELRDAVDEALRDIKQNMGGEERYREELQKQGLTEAEVRDLHREQKRKQILASRLIQTDVRRGISITDDQVRTFYDTQKDSIPKELLATPEKIKLEHILITPRPDPKKVAAARTKMEAAQKRIAAGEDFAKVAREMSEWPTAASGGSLGSFRYGDFESDAFDATVAKLEPGQVSEIFETRFGLQIVKLETRKGDDMTARHIVVKLEPDEDAGVRALDQAQSIRTRADKGESFEELARTYSDDTNTRDKGGLVDEELDTSEIVPEFRAAIDSVAVGGMTPVVHSANGFHIFKVVSRSESRVASFDDVKEPLRRYLEQREVEKKYRTYLEDLRKKFFVDIKV